MVTLIYTAGKYTETVLTNVPRAIAEWKKRELSKTTHRTGKFKIKPV